MSKAKAVKAAVTGFQFAAPTADETKPVVEALRLIAGGKGRIKSAQDNLSNLDAAKVSPFGIVAQFCAAYVLGILAQYPQLAGEQRRKLAKQVTKTCNAALSGSFGKRAASSIKSTLSQIHRVVLHPATTVQFGQGWRDGNYNMAIPSEPASDKEASLTLKEGTRRVVLANKPATPEAMARKWLEANAKRASNARNFYAMVAAVIENLLATPVEKVA